MSGIAGLGEADMINCRDVATLLETEQLAGEPLWRRLQVRLHLSMCRHCRALKRQIAQLGSAARRFRTRIEAEVDEKDLAERLSRRLRGNGGAA